jgi:heptosyltransferase I
MVRRQAPDLRRLERVLIVKLSSIGDVVHALPVSAALGESFPHLKISWLVEQRAAPIVLGNPYLHEVIVLPDSFRSLVTPGVLQRFVRLRTELQERRFDLTIDLQGLARSAIAALLSGVPRRRRFGYDFLREGSSILERRVRRRPGSTHVVDQMLDLARYLGATVAEVRFPFAIPPEDEAQAREMLAAEGIGPDERFVAINPTNGGYGHKGLGVERATAVIDDLGDDCRLPMLLVGGSEDGPIEAAILSRARRRPKSVVGRTSLKQLAAILRRSAVHLAGDTGSAHLAAALGTPVVAVFGRTNPARVAPRGNRDRVLHHRERCSPVCSLYHKIAPLNADQRCYTLPPRCLSAITAGEIAAAARQCLRQAEEEPRGQHPRR